MQDENKPTSVADELAALRREKLEKARAAEKKAEREELELLKLEAALEAKLGGPRGVMFDIVESGVRLGEGLIAVRLGEAVLHKQFVNSKITDADVAQYVRPNVVHPSLEKYDEIVGRRPGLAHECANKLAKLYGVKLGDDAGKA